MKKLILFSILLLITLGLTLALTTQPGQALPEYSSQTGEPCATCHISPSGGGLRTPRGQAWVGGGKPGYVPDLTEALELLGVELDIDESDYVVVPESIPPAQPLSLEAEPPTEVHNWLVDYTGN